MVAKINTRCLKVLHEVCHLMFKQIATSNEPVTHSIICSSNTAISVHTLHVRHHLFFLWPHFLFSF